MAQIFSRRADRLANVALGAVALVIVVAMLRLLGIIPPGALAGTAKPAGHEQPRDFSHAHHVGEIGIQCGYCHTETTKGPEAGYPPVTTCAGCHLPVGTAALPPPLVWTRVSKVPDHVQFHHAVHVTKGIACESCHGDVASMDRVVQPLAFTMAFCLDCHRETARTAGIDAQRLTSCNVCHY